MEMQWKKKTISKNTSRITLGMFKDQETLVVPNGIALRSTVLKGYFVQK